MLTDEMKNYILEEISATRKYMEKDIERLIKDPISHSSCAINIVRNAGYIQALRGILYMNREDKKC